MAFFRRRELSIGELIGFINLGKIISYLESHSIHDHTMKLEKVGLVNLGKRQLDELLVQAATSVGQTDDYKPSSETHLLLLKTLIQNGADVSALFDYWYDGVSDRDHADVPFVRMIVQRIVFREMETALDDIEFLIKEKHALSKLRESQLENCLSWTFLNDNIPLLQLFVDNGAIFPSDFVFMVFDETFYDRPLRPIDNIEQLGRIFDLMVEGKTKMDLKTITPLNGFFAPEVRTTVLQWPISQYLRKDPDILDKLDHHEGDWDFLFGKGHLAPPPEAFTYALSESALTYIYTIVHLCLTRGIELEFPDLKTEDKSKFHWGDAHDRTKKVAVLLEEMIRRSGCYCPHSFLLTLSEASGVGRKFPSLKIISVAAIRKSWLIPDKDERFPDSRKLFRDIPVKPRLIIPLEVRSMIPPAMCDLVLFKDLRKDYEEIPKYPDTSDSETETEYETDIETDSDF